MSTKYSMAVYCGHQFGSDDKFKHDAAILGKLMAENGIKLVFGGGDVGLMGTVATAVITNGGSAIGVSTPHVAALQEPKHEGLPVEIAKNISERRQRMYELSDAFCILPGGMGTLDELTDIMVRQQIKETQKPLFFLNTRNFWGSFGKLFLHMHAAGFIPNPAAFDMKIFNHPEDIVHEFMSRFKNE